MMTRRPLIRRAKLNVRFPGKHTFLGQDVPLLATLGDTYDAGVAALDHLLQRVLDLIAGHCANHARSSP
jgi:hypothetical protein